MSILGLLASWDDYLPVTCLPATVRQYATFPVFIDTKRLPLNRDLIENIANDFVKVNEILMSGWIDPVSLEDLVILKWILLIQDEELMKEKIIELETQNKSLGLWLHFYLELRAPIEDIDPMWKDAYKGIHGRLVAVLEE